MEAPAKTGKKKKWLLLAIIGGAAVVLLALGLFLGIPLVKYLSANSALEQGQYQKALTIYEDLGGFLSSPEKLKACKIGQAEVWLREGNFEDAKNLYLELGDGENAKECDYRQALAWVAQGKFQEAVTGFEALGDYKDSADQIIESKYQWILALMTQGDYQQALEKLPEIGEYKDSLEKITECQYQSAVKLLEAGNYTEAKTILDTLGDYKDAKELVKECKYQAALALLEKGQVVKAYDALIALKNYKDSAERAKEVKTAYTRIKGKSKIFVNATWSFYDKIGIDSHAGMTTKKVNSNTVKIKIFWDYCDTYLEEKGDKNRVDYWEFTGKWDPATGRLNYTKGKNYTITYTLADPATGKTTKKTKTKYSNGTGYFYYQNSKLYWKSNNGEKDVYFKRAK